jgi:hypothetical protein
MTDEQREILRHALGLTRGDAVEPTRNYYADEPEAKECSALVDKGAMVKGRIMEGGLQLYHVTNFGKELAMKPIGWDA